LFLIFKNSGLIHFTDLKVNKQRTCLIGRKSNCKFYYDPCF
jgi:hypothetical protein